MNLIAGLIGISMLVAFLGVLIWWIKAPPLAIIILIVLAMLFYDFYLTLRQENGRAG